MVKTAAFTYTTSYSVSFGRIDKLMNIHAYTDGACSGNPGPGGWGAVIFDQDKRIVESQRPIQVPFDLSEELHLKFDSVALNYRRAMKKNKLYY